MISFSNDFHLFKKEIQVFKEVIIRQERVKSKIDEVWKKCMRKEEML